MQLGQNKFEKLEFEIKRLLQSSILNIFLVDIISSSPSLEVFEKKSLINSTFLTRMNDNKGEKAK